MVESVIQETAWYVTVANIFSYTGSFTLLTCMFAQENLKMLFIISVFCFSLASVFGWLPNILSMVKGFI